MAGPKVYLAGKITKNGWRNDVIGRTQTRFMDGWPGNEWADDVLHGGWSPWLPEPSLLEAGPPFDVTGPFFVTCDHGCAHNNSTHATVGGCIATGSDGEAWRHREAVRQLCFKAIDQSDIVFAWLDDPTAYGTLVEIGYAHGTGKCVVVAEPDYNWGGIELWFGRHGTAFYPGVHSSDGGPVAQLVATVEWWHEQNRTFDSPVEKQFWDAYKATMPPQLVGLTNQHPVGRYRLDFALPAKRVGFEVDGLAYHGSQEQFMADQKRQRELSEQGWRIHRFAAKEVMLDANACVAQAARLAAA